MSAYICNPAHIRELAAFAVSHHGGVGTREMNVAPRYLPYRHPDFAAIDERLLDDDDIATYYAAVLWDENIRSVRTRYPNDDWNSLPGPIGKPLQVVVRYGDITRRRVTNPAHILKMCDGYSYQACGTEDWEQTKAHALIQEIRAAAWRQVPGYDEGPWEYSDAPFDEAAS